MPRPGVTLANETGGLAMEMNLVPLAEWVALLMVTMDVE
jgi:hypothetical protein